ncbi:MAG: hypothetical protein QGF59_24655 [Pirellulaceae bacterium]|nr:hypothetical protein [Pirellulaceae bacterium]
MVLILVFLGFAVLVIEGWIWVFNVDLVDQLLPLWTQLGGRRQIWGRSWNDRRQRSLKSDSQVYFPGVYFSVSVARFLRSVSFQLKMKSEWSSSLSTSGVRVSV